MFNEFEEAQKIFFCPGEIVKVRHEKLDNIPNMYVVEKVTRNLFNKDLGTNETAFIGIKCRWFDNNANLREAVFSTKDLVHVE